MAKRYPPPHKSLSATTGTPLAIERKASINGRAASAPGSEAFVLKRSELRYRRLFEAADDGILMLDPVTRKITEANPYIVKLLGYSRKQLIKKELWEIGLLKDEVANQQAFRTLKHKGSIRYENLPLSSKTGQRLEVEFVSNLYLEQGKEVIQCNIRDITARKQIEAALRAAQAQLAAHAQGLEKLVIIRTAKVTATNKLLEASVKSVSQGREKYRVLFLASQLMQKKLQHLARQILSVQEDERRKISRDLHDEVVQTLVGINVELGALGRASSLGPEALKAKISLTQQLVEKSVTAVHQFARELRPAVLDDLGLNPALHTYLKTVAAESKLQIRLTTFDGIETLDIGKRTMLYRVVQESVTNVVRHAQASLVDVGISRISRTICMEVRDNGKSFPVEQTLAAKTNKRLGLLGMRERIEMVGGNLTIESAAGQGTTIRAVLPFRSRNAA